MADSLQFRVDGLSRRDLERWKKLRRSPGATGSFPTAAATLSKGTFLLSAALTLAVVYAVRSSPTAIVEGMEVTARRVLVLVDGSGSMSDARLGDTSARLKRHLEQLDAAGISAENTVTIMGFGVRRSGHSLNLLNGLEDRLRGDVEFDAVYFYSDFTWANDPPVDGSDEDGFRRMRRLLADRRIRLYLGTVRSEPDEGLVALARESGGELIRAR